MEAVKRSDSRFRRRTEYLVARPMPADDCCAWIVRASGEPQRLAV